jgi:TorA maturation chaperone TorD
VTPAPWTGSARPRLSQLNRAEPDPHWFDAVGASCAVLARALLAPVDAALLAMLRRPDMLWSWPIPVTVASTGRGLRLLRHSAATHESVEDIAADYQRLFVGPGPMLAPPYESVYLGRDRLLFEEPTRQVRAAYARFGLVAPNLNAEPDDHLGLEFDFAARLCTAALDADDRGDETSVGNLAGALADFAQQHLQRWGPICLGLITDRAETAFYQGLSHLGLGVLARFGDASAAEDTG